MLERFFKLKENKTDVRTEVIAGITTFMTMAYILIVNPQMLGLIDGMSFGGVFIATALAGVVGTVCMAFLANYPFALAPGMGLNAFFAFSVVLAGRLTWQGALTAVFLEGIIFLILTFCNAREALLNVIPMELKFAVSAGIGLFIAFIGFKNAGIVVADQATFVTINHEMTSLTVILAVIGLIVIFALEIKKVKGSVLIGIVTVWALTIILELMGVYVPNPEMGTFSAIPTLQMGGGWSEMNWFQFDFSQVATFDFWVIMASFLFVDLFDTLGTLIGVSEKAGYLDEKGQLPNAKQALLADAVATTFGACCGTSTTTTYVESAAGVAAGGRTGLTGLTVAILFAIAIPFSSVFAAIPSFATAPALIAVGFFMVGSISKVDFTDFRVGIPAFLTFLVMPLTYSISEGIAFGIISYTILHAVTGKAKKVNWLMWVLTILFILRYVFL